jgi:hypothetical protein
LDDRLKQGLLDSVLLAINEEIKLFRNVISSLFKRERMETLSKTKQKVDNIYTDLRVLDPSKVTKPYPS